MKGSYNSKFCTMLGLSQGSDISPLLFNLFIKDIYASVEGKKVKFEDDGTICRHRHTRGVHLILALMRLLTTWL